MQAQSIRMTTALSCFKLIASPSGSSLAFSIKLMQQRRSLYDWIGEMNLLPQHLTCSSKWLREIVSTLEMLISLKRLNTGQWPDRERQSNRLNQNVHRYQSHVLSCYLKALHGFVLFGEKRDHKRLGRLIGPSGKSMRSLNDTVPKFLSNGRSSRCRDIAHVG